MVHNGEVNVSPNFSKADYLNLNLALDSDPEDWNHAVRIFDDRISGRYLNQINLLSTDINTNGFAIMALNCLLIETLLQFREGVDNTPFPNKDIYSNFLMQEFPHAFNTESKAKRFYRDVRCGILHSAQTRGKTRLSDDDSFTVSLQDTVLTVSVSKLSEILQEYFCIYKTKLLDETEINLRERFINKMKCVCRK